MNKESLIKAKDIIIKALSNSSITEFDKVELMVNISTLLNHDRYEENIKILKRGSNYDNRRI